MAVEVSVFSSASAPIHEGRDGDMELVSMHEYVEAIQYQSSILESDLIQNNEDFLREVDRILRTILLKISPVSQIPEPSMRNYNSMTIASEVVPVLECPDGGHRCPYFPCPTCHRTRSIFGLKSTSHTIRSESSNWKSALIMECGEDEVVDQENPSTISNASIIIKVRSDLFVSVLECGDGGHRCPYFPCPTCHRSRSIFPSTESNSNFPNFDCNLDLMTFESEGDKISDRMCPALIMYPDGGHKCPYFPCPICHKKDRRGEFIIMYL